MQMNYAPNPKGPANGGWVLERNIENAHQHQISDITSVENLLFSTSYKNLKVWDLNEMKQISDIKAHQGAIKCVKASMGSGGEGEVDGAADSLFVTAGDKSDKSLHLWDMTSLTCLATLRGHKGEIRAVEFSKNGKHIFSAGMGGMLVWDLRNTDTPLELVEKHMDIFSLKTTDNMLFMGCRNHSIIPMGLHPGQPFHQQVMQPIKSPHLDIVTSLGTLFQDRVLISASLDHNIRAWSIPDSLAEGLPQLKNLTIDKAHNSQINVVAAGHDGLELYSGSKDGVVNIWSLQNQLQLPDDPGAENIDEQELMQGLSLVRTGQLQAHGGSVTAIAAIEPESTGHGKMLIYGGSDKTLRIFKDSDDPDKAQHAAPDHRDQPNEEDVVS